MRDDFRKDRKRGAPRSPLRWCRAISLALEILNQLIEFELRATPEGLDVVKRVWSLLEVGGLIGPPTNRH